MANHTHGLSSLNVEHLSGFFVSCFNLNMWHVNIKWYDFFHCLCQQSFLHGGGGKVSSPYPYGQTGVVLTTLAATWVWGWWVMITLVWGKGNAPRPLHRTGMTSWLAQVEGIPPGLDLSPGTPQASWTKGSLKFQVPATQHHCTKQWHSRIPGCRSAGGFKGLTNLSVSWSGSLTSSTECRRSYGAAFFWPCLESTPLNFFVLVQML